MEKEELMQAVEAMMFANGKPVKPAVIAEILEVEVSDVVNAIEDLRIRLIERNSGIQVIKVNDAYQLATLEKFYSYICTMLDNRPKPTLSQAALEVLSIVAYNQNATRAEIEKIRGVSSDSALNKLIEYVHRETPVGGRSSIHLIAEKGKESFYVKLGFKFIPHEFCGSAMRKVIRN